MAQTAINEGVEQEFTAAGLTLAAKRWGIKGGRPIVALHGWLDNCASFDFLAPLLDDCDVLCLDCAGHGLSDHRSHLGAYNIWQDVAEVFAVADQAGWQTFTLLGHSRGAMAALLAAGTFPSRIDHLVLLEGACPRLAEAEQTAENLAESIRFVNACLQRPKSTYASFDAAVDARRRGLFPVAHDDAIALAHRGVVPIDGGFTWRYDPKLMAGSELKLNKQQVESFCQRLAAPCLLLMAADGALVGDKALQQWLDLRHEWTVRVLPGGHHFHMSEHCREVAASIVAFFHSSDSNNRVKR